MKRFLTQLVYDLKIQHLLKTLNFEDIPYLMDNFSNYVNEPGETPGVVYTVRRINGYDFYCDRVHFRIESLEGVLGVKVFLYETPGDWEGESYEIFTWCKQILYTGTTFRDFFYYSGSWNEYAYGILTKIIDVISMCDNSVKFNRLFKNVK